MNLVFAAGVLVPQHIAGLDYFRGVRGAYPDALFPNVPVTATVDARAKAFADQVSARFPTGPIHVVAHSMGGLDTRYTLSTNLKGLANPDRIVSLSTISTPHRGSPIADLLVGPKPDGPGFRPFVYELLNHALEHLSITIAALGELTTAYTATFNTKHLDVPHVRYRSYAGAGVGSLVLKPAHLYIQTVGQTDDERANDGIVSLASAKWGEFIGPPWDGDHFSELGYSFNSPTLHSKFDHLAAIRQVVQRATQ